MCDMFFSSNTRTTRIPHPRYLATAIVFYLIIIIFLAKNVPLEIAINLENFRHLNLLAVAGVRTFKIQNPHLKITQAIPVPLRCHSYALVNIGMFDEGSIFELEHFLDTWPQRTNSGLA